MSRLIAFAGLLCAATAHAADPPRPNPDHPVDYVKWVNEQFGKDITSNAADIYRQAIAAFKPDEGVRQLAEGTDAKDWTDDDRNRIRQWVQANAECLEKLATAARVPKCYFKCESESGALMEVILAEAPQTAIRNPGRVTSARARLRLLENNVDGAVDDVATLLRVGRHMHSQPTMIQYMIGFVFDAWGYDILLDVPRLASGPVDYERIIGSLKDADRASPRPFRQFQTEKLMAWDFLQRYLSDADGDGRLEMPSPPEWFVTGTGTLRRPRTLDSLLSEIDEVFDALREVFVRDYQQAKRRAEVVDELMATKKGTLVGTLLPSLTPVALFQRRVIADRHAYRVIFYLHAYHAKNNRWPEKLDQALSKSAARRLIDPFSNKPFGYRLKDGRPLLYSVGENGLDDGGEVFRDADGKPGWGKTGDFVYWPRQKD